MEFNPAIPSGIAITWRAIMRNWTTPYIVEICLGCEINCYMSAER